MGAVARVSISGSQHLLPPTTTDYSSPPPPLGTGITTNLGASCTLRRLAGWLLAPELVLRRQQQPPPIQFNAQKPIHTSVSRVQPLPLHDKQQKSIHLITIYTTLLFYTN
jgi:hypothetical protein